MKKILSYSALAILIAVSATLGSQLAIDKAKARKTAHEYVCAQFNKWEDAEKAYTAGATYLDGDHDGIPCQNLYEKELKSDQQKLSTIKP